MFKQIASITGLNLRSLGSRLGLNAVIVVGIAGVVGVLIALLAMSRGFESTLKATGRPDRALILRDGRLGEECDGKGDQRGGALEVGTKFHKPVPYLQLRTFRMLRH